MRCLHVNCFGVMGRLTVAVDGALKWWLSGSWVVRFPYPLLVRQGPCQGLEVLDWPSFERVCVLQSKCLLGLQGAWVNNLCSVYVCKWLYLCVCMLWIKYLVSKVLALKLSLSTWPWLVLVDLHGTCSATEGSGPGIPTIPLLIANSKCTDHSPPISSTELQIQWCEQKLESMHRTLCTSLRFVQFWTRLVSCSFTSTNWKSDL